MVCSVYSALLYTEAWVSRWHGVSHNNILYHKSSVILYSTHLPSLGIFPHLCLGTVRREISIQTLLFLLFNTFPILTSPSYLHMILCFDFVLNIRTHELFFPLNHVFKKLNWWRGEKEKHFQTPKINHINTLFKAVISSFRFKTSTITNNLLFAAFRLSFLPHRLQFPNVTRTHNI